MSFKFFRINNIKPDTSAEKYNGELRKYVEKKQLHLVDFEEHALEILQPRSEYYNDSVHFTSEGYLEMGKYASREVHKIWKYMEGYKCAQELSVRFTTSLTAQKPVARLVSGPWECCAGCKVEAAALDQGVNFIDTAAMYGDALVSGLMLLILKNLKLT